MGIFGKKPAASDPAETANPGEPGAENTSAAQDPAPDTEQPKDPDPAPAQGAGGFGLNSADLQNAGKARG